MTRWDNLLSCVERTDADIKQLDVVCKRVGEPHKNAGRLYTNLSDKEKSDVDTLIDSIVGALLDCLAAAVKIVVPGGTGGPARWDSDTLDSTLEQGLKHKQAFAVLKTLNKKGSEYSALVDAACVLTLLSDKNRKLVFVPLPGLNADPQAVTVGIERNVHGYVQRALGEPCSKVVQSAESVVAVLQTTCSYIEFFVHEHESFPPS